MAGQRGKGNFILKIDTGSGTATWTTLEHLMSGVSFSKYLEKPLKANSAKYLQSIAKAVEIK